MTSFLKLTVLSALCLSSAAFAQDLVEETTPLEPAPIKFIWGLQSAPGGFSVEVALEAPAFEAPAYAVSITKMDRGHVEEVAWGNLVADADGFLSLSFNTLFDVDLDIEMVAVDELGFEIELGCGADAAGGDTSDCTAVQSVVQGTSKKQKTKTKKKVKVDIVGQVHITNG
jgi:hypothetical protein